MRVVLQLLTAAVLIGGAVWITAIALRDYIRTRARIERRLGQAKPAHGLPGGLSARRAGGVAQRIVEQAHG